MSNRSWGVVAGLGLLGLCWLMLDPRPFSRSPESSAPSKPSSFAEAQEQGRKEGSSRPAQLNEDSKVEALLETDSGKEVPGEKLVQFTSVEGYRKFLAMAPSGAILGQIDALNSARVKTGAWLENALSENGGTGSANFYIRVPEVPLDIREKGETWYQAVGKRALELVGAEGVANTWGRGVKVALMDTPVEGMDKVEGESAGHGTAMRSLIQGLTGAARGAAPAAELLAFPVLDQHGKGDCFGLAEAIMKATDQGVRVINMSLGSKGDSPVVKNAVAYALAKNVVLVAAVGNEAANQVSYPAAYDGVIGVASVDAVGSHLYFSNRGQAVDVAAPGFAVVAAWPGGKNVEVSGTSASTALVTGIMAALLSREPGLSGRQAADLLVKHADTTGLPGVVAETGGGVVNLQRVLERNQRGIVDVAVGGVTLKEEGSTGRIMVGIQNRGTETVNSCVLEISAGNERRKFYFGSLSPGGTGMEGMNFDLGQARQEGGIGAGAVVSVRGDQRVGNDLWSGYFRISKGK